MVKLGRSVTDVTLFLVADPTRQKSHHLNLLHNHRKQNEKVFLCDKQIHAAVSTCELRAGGLLSQPLMIVGEPKVTRLRHSELPLATGSGLRSTEGGGRSQGAGRWRRRRQERSWTFHIPAGLSVLPGCLVRW